MPIASATLICNMALGYAGVTKKISSVNPPDPSVAAQQCSNYYDPYLRQMLASFRWPWAVRRAALQPYTGNTWTASTTYTVGQLVQFGNNVYRALLGSTGAEPDKSPAQWAQVTRDGWGYTCPLPTDCISPICAWESPDVSAGDSLHPYFFPYDADLGQPGLRNPLSTQRPPFDIEDANDGTGNQVLITDLDSPVLKYVAYITNTYSYSDLFIDAFAYKLGVALNGALRSDVSKAQYCEQMYRSRLAEAISGANRDKQEDPEPMSEFEAARMGIY